MDIINNDTSFGVIQQYATNAGPMSIDPFDIIDGFWLVFLETVLKTHIIVEDKTILPGDISFLALVNVEIIEFRRCDMHNINQNCPIMHCDVIVFENCVGMQFMTTHITMTQIEIGFTSLALFQQFLHQSVEVLEIVNKADGIVLYGLYDFIVDSTYEHNEKYMTAVDCLAYITKMVQDTNVLPPVVMNIVCSYL
jgi:hypothetical protein